MSKDSALTREDGDRALHCPFCADDLPRTVHDTSSDYEQNWSWWIECSNLSCEAKGPEATTEQDAIERWNKRPQPVPSIG